MSGDGSLREQPGSALGRGLSRPLRQFDSRYTSHKLPTLLHCTSRQPWATS
jgi:hypothetical protein